MTTLLDPTTAAPADDALGRLRLACTGEVLVAGDPGFDAACSGFNVRMQHRPAVLVLPETTADVVAAVRYARAAGLQIGVQATGHGQARTADGAVLVNTSRLVGVEVDAAARTACIAGGTTWQPVLDAAAEVGLAPLLGSTPHVGAVGYTLGGGMGWLGRQHGLSLDKVVSFELVTPDGELRVASAEREPELFYALRGAGAGSLGIVTAMTVELVPVTTVYGGNLLYPATMAPEVLARYAAWVETLPDTMTTSVVLMNFPPFEEVPEPLRGRSFVIVRGCCCGPLEQGEELLRYWREWSAPAVDLFGPMPFSQVATISNDPEGPLPGLSTTEWLTDLGPETADVLVGAAYGDGQGPPPLVFAEVRHVGGAVSRSDAGAFGNRSSTLLLHLVGVAPTPEAGAGLEAHLDAVRAGLARHTTGGTYLNFAEGEEKRRRSRTGFRPDALERLARVKATLDGDDVLGLGVDLG